MSKSIDQRLYEAARRERGIRLTSKDVLQLIFMDDAIGSRITDQAWREANGRNGSNLLNGDSATAAIKKAETWAEFVASLKE